MKSLSSRLLAPLTSGAVFFVSLLLALGCDQKKTPSAGGILPTAAEVEQSQRDSADHGGIAEKKAKVTTKVVSTNSKPPATGSGLRFLAYNVENWLLLDDRYDAKSHTSSKNAPKPDQEKAAVIAIVNGVQPDVLGVCEIGTKEDLTDIQSRLKSAGLDLPHSHYVGGMDSVRHLGLLSRFPIVATATPAATTYKLNGKEYGIQRGILDASIKSPDGRLWRFLGVHFKSKREVEDGDQNEMRINEAQLLRQHIDAIFKDDPQARLISYGDFNDTRASAPIRIVQGSRNSPRAMSPIGAHDSREEYWTHFWSREDIYSRFDYILFSPALKKDVCYEECKILDPENWNDASDHRAVLGVFR